MTPIRRCQAPAGRIGSVLGAVSFHEAWEDYYTIARPMGQEMAARRFVKMLPGGHPAAQTRNASCWMRPNASD